MKISRLLAALLAALTLSACVGFIVPIPIKSSGSDTQTTEQNQQR